MYNIAKLISNRYNLNDFGQTSLHLAVRISDLSLVDRLLKEGADPNVMDAFDGTPLSIACIDVPNKVIAELLIENGAQINLPGRMHLNFFLECVLSCHTPEQLEIVELLIEHRADVNVTDEMSKRNCLHMAAVNGNVELAKLLIINGALIETEDKFNLKPLDVAERQGNYEIVDLYLSFSREL